MKRSAMPRRLAPIERRTPLASGRPPKRRTPLNKKGRKARREESALAAFRAALRTRSRGLCELDCGRLGTDAHHCCPADRDRGVHDPDRGLFLCRWCHNRVHSHPAESYRRGWLLVDDGGKAA